MPARDVAKSDSNLDAVAGVPLRLAVICHGRFHLFELAGALAKLGHDVTLYTMYPPWYCRRFGLTKVKIVPALHLAALVALYKIRLPQSLRYRLSHHWNVSFGKWAAARIAKQPKYHAVLSMTGVALECFEQLPPGTLKVLHRGSIHIREQRLVLEAEEVKVGRPVDKPMDANIAREEAEYGIADLVHVLSSQSLASFTNRLPAMTRLHRIGLGVDTSRFSATPIQVTERQDRFQGATKLRILGVGTFSHRKGARLWDEFLSQPESEQFQIRFVGDVNTDAREIAHKHKERVEFIPRVHQHKLPEHYAWADIFCILSVEDGFPAVVPQALASCVPVVVAPGCGGTDMLTNNVNGWILSSHTIQALNATFEQIQNSRSHIIEMIGQMSSQILTYDWKHTAHSVIANISSCADTTDTPAHVKNKSSA